MNKVKQWAKIRGKLKKVYSQKGIIRCEACGSDYLLSFHHRHKRRHYAKGDDLGSFNQTVLLCAHCHNDYEYDREANRELFNKLRGEE